MEINDIKCLIVKLNHLLNISDSSLPYESLLSMGFTAEQRNAQVMKALDALDQLDKIN